MDKRSTKQNVDINTALSFVEDICWLIDAKRNMNFSEIPKILKKSIKDNDALSNYESAEGLIGILPTLLVDNMLFKTNKELYDFSNEMLGFEIKNWHKRSRNEMIGVIICEVEKSDKVKDKVFANLLTHIKNNKEKIKILQNENKDNQFSWNDTIQKIVEMDNEPNY